MLLWLMGGVRLSGIVEIEAGFIQNIDILAVTFIFMEVVEKFLLRFRLDDLLLWCCAVAEWGERAAFCF